MKFYLLYGASEELEITSECQIGRRNGDLKFSDELLSGTHAKFINDGEKLYLTDLGSSNGTYINRKKIEAQIPHEVNDGDEIVMGAQRIKIKKVDNESTRIEESYSPGESTRIESPISRVEAQNAAPAVEEAPLIAIVKDETAPKSEATHVEALSEFTPAEELRSPAPLKPERENTHIEKEEYTHIEVSNPAPATPSLKIASISRDEAPKVAQITHIPRPSPAKLAQVEESETPPIAAVANDMVNVFGAKKIMIATALVIGVFAFLLNGPKKHERAPAQTKIKVEPAAQNSSQFSVHTETTSSAESSSSMEISSSSPQSIEKITEAFSSSSIKTEAESIPVKELKTEPIKKIKASKKTSKKTKSETSLKSTPKDPYAEAALLKKLSKLREESKRTRSPRVKAALEVDAVDLVSAHYKKFKTAILLKWKKNRGLASDEKSKLKKTLQGQIIALNNREKQVRAKISLYINGKIETPFK